MPKFGSFESKRRTAVILKYFSPEHSHLVIPDTPEEIPDDWEFKPDVTDTDIRDISLRVTSARETAGDPLSYYNPRAALAPNNDRVDLPARHVLVAGVDGGEVVTHDHATANGWIHPGARRMRARRGESTQRPVDKTASSRRIILGRRAMSVPVIKSWQELLSARPTPPVASEDEIGSVYKRAKVDVHKRNKDRARKMTTIMDESPPPKKKQKKKRTAPLYGAILPALLYETNRTMFESKLELLPDIRDHYNLNGVSRMELAGYVAKEFKRDDPEEFSRLKDVVGRQWKNAKKERRAHTMLQNHPEWKSHFLLTSDRLERLDDCFGCYLCKGRGLLMRCENTDCSNQAHPSCEGINMKNPFATCPSTYFCRVCLPNTQAR